MSTATLLAAVALGAVVVLSCALVRISAHLRALEASTARLDDDLHARVEPDVAAARAEARDATTLARRASVAAGVDEPPPRLPFEPVTGKVVRAVAFGAGARRAIARATAPAWSRRRSA
jgi:hypothetical protein